MEIKYENGYAIVDNLKFKKDTKSGYYLSTYINGKRYRLHRYLYEKYKGDIPKGCEVHHIDHNKDNNDLNNLILLTKKEHKILHGRELTEKQREFYRKNLNENVRPKAIKWHKSEEAKEWHREQYKKTLGNRKPQKFKCKYCGIEYESMNNGINSFCSNKCKSAWRRESGIDNEPRKCIICGEEFICNKYSKKGKCNNCTPNKYKKNR